MTGYDGDRDVTPEQERRMEQLKAQVEKERLAKLPHGGKSFAGVDPGADGCLAVIRPDDSVEFYDPPMASVELTTKSKITGKKKTRRVYLFAELAEIMRGARIDHLVLENVVAMPRRGPGGVMIQMGATSALSSGIGFGMWQMACACLGIPFQLVAPNHWKAVLMEGQPKTKEAVVPFAARLYPGAAGQLRGPQGGLKTGRADALLLGHFGRLGLR